MKKKVISAIVGGFIIAASVLGTNMKVFAASGNGTVRVPTGCAMVNAVSKIERTENSNSLKVRAQAVYPVGAYTEDNFKKCKSALYHYAMGNTQISDAEILIEGDADYTTLTIYEVYSGLSKVNLHFSGNNPDYAAYVNYYYTTY